jgi:hypothetical protein
MSDEQSKQYDPEETKEEAAARRIDKGSDAFAARCDLFVTSLRSNARDLTPYKRQIVSGWLKRHCERLQATLDEGEGIPRLGLDGLPDYDD